MGGRRGPVFQAPVQRREEWTQIGGDRHVRLHGRLGQLGAVDITWILNAREAKACQL